MFMIRSNTALLTDMENIDKNESLSGNEKAWKTVESRTVFDSKYVTEKCDEVELDCPLKNCSVLRYKSIHKYHSLLFYSYSLSYYFALLLRI